MTYLFYQGVNYIGFVTFDEGETDIPFYYICEELCGTERTISLYLNDAVYSGVTVRKEHIQ